MIDKSGNSMIAKSNSFSKFFKILPVLTQSLALLEIFVEKFVVGAWRPRIKYHNQTIQFPCRSRNFFLAHKTVPVNCHCRNCFDSPITKIRTLSLSFGRMRWKITVLVEYGLESLHPDEKRTEIFLFLCNEV